MQYLRLSYVALLVLLVIGTVILLPLETSLDLFQKLIPMLVSATIIWYKRSTFRLTLEYLRLSYVVFLVFLTISTLLTVPLQAAWILLVFKLVPLLLFFPAVWQKKSYGLLALTLLVLVYMGFSTMNCFADGLKQLFAFIELIAATWLILACSKAVKSLPRGHGAA